MPVYAYECDAHGGFDLLRPMSESGRTAPCPECGRPAGRVLTAPQVFSMGPARRDAAERNERSRHAPHVCGTGCGHHAPPSRAAPGAGAGAARPRRDGRPPLQSYTGPRPWVVEHS